MDRAGIGIIIRKSCFNSKTIDRKRLLRRDVFNDIIEFHPEVEQIFFAVGVSNLLAQTISGIARTGFASTVTAVHRLAAGAGGESRFVKIIADFCIIAFFIKFIGIPLIRPFEIVKVEVEFRENIADRRSHHYNIFFVVIFIVAVVGAGGEKVAAQKAQGAAFLQVDFLLAAQHCQIFIFRQFEGVASDAEKVIGIHLDRLDIRSNINSGRAFRVVVRVINPSAVKCFAGIKLHDINQHSAAGDIAIHGYIAGKTVTAGIDGQVSGIT